MWRLKNSVLVCAVCVMGIINAMEEKKSVREMAKAFLQPNASKLPMAVLPNGSKIVHQDFLTIIAAFKQMDPIAQVELAKAVHQEKKLDDPKVIEHLIAYKLANSDGRLLKPVTEVIAGVTKFEDGKLCITENCQIEGQPSPNRRHPLKFALKEHDNSKPGDNQPCPKTWAYFFTIHELAGDDHCLTYCSGTNHPVATCRNGECARHYDKDVGKFAREGHHRIVEFSDYTKSHKAFYPRKSDENYQSLVSWARTQLWQPAQG